MTAHPINAVIVDGAAPSKSALRSYLQARQALVLVSASEILTIDVGSTVAIMLATTGAAYRYDATDTTTAHNGTTVLVDSTGRRFKLATPSALRANVYTNIISASLTAPPGSPAEGDAYIVAPAATGAWATHDNTVAVWSSGAWWFDIPRPGAFAWVGGLYVFNGTTWSLVGQTTSGIGYSTGAGGAVTQLTSKATGVALNKFCGQITMNNAALAGGAVVSFILTNSAIAQTDVVNAQHGSAGTAGAYRVAVKSSGSAGSVIIEVTNTTGGSLSEAIVINFAVFKAVAA